ncbi:MAG: hypothetical protein LBQ77_07655 [Treponema sp.]|jgi:hypothetical protein|nr:hypothetical protein [Treponema sp.]
MVVKNWAQRLKPVLFMLILLPTFVVILSCKSGKVILGDNVPVNTVTASPSESQSAATAPATTASPSESQSAVTAPATTASRSESRSTSDRLQEIRRELTRLDAAEQDLNNRFGDLGPYVKPEQFDSLASNYVRVEGVYKNVTSDFTRVDGLFGALPVSDRNSGDGVALKRQFDTLNTAHTSLGQDIQDSKIRAFRGFDATLEDLDNRVLAKKSSFEALSGDINEQPVIDFKTIIPTFSKESDEIAKLGKEYDEKKQVVGVLTDLNTLSTTPGTVTKAKFDKLTTDYTDLTNDERAARAALFSRLNDSIAKLEKDTATLDKDIGNIAPFTQTSSISDLVKKETLYKANVDGIIKQLADAYNLVEAENNQLASDFATERTVLNEKVLGPLAKTEDGTKLFVRFGNAEKQYDVVSNKAESAKTFAANVLADYNSLLGQELKTQQNAWNGFVTQVNALPPDLSGIGTVVQSFVTVKDGVEKLDQPFKSGNTIRENMGDFAYQEPGATLALDFGNNNVEYSALKNQVEGTESAAIQEVEYQLTSLQSILLGDEKGNAGLYDRLDSLGERYPQDSQFSQRLRELYTIRYQIADLRQNELVIGDNVIAGLGPYGKEGQPGALWTLKYNELKSNIDTLDGNVSSEEKKLINGMETKITSLGNEVRALEAKLGNGIGTPVNTRAEVSARLDLTTLKSDVTSLSQRISIGKQARDAIREYIPTNVDGQRVVAKFDIVEANFNGVQTAVNQLDIIK